MTLPLVNIKSAGAVAGALPPKTVAIASPIPPRAAMGTLSFKRVIQERPTTGNLTAEAQGGGQ
jgi:hypothetical protein